MAWNPNKNKSDKIPTVINVDARLNTLSEIYPKPSGFEESPKTPLPIPNSNQPANNKQEGDALLDKLSSVARENQVRRDKDNVTNQSIGLETIDEAIINYMQNDLNISVVNNGQEIKVPVIYGSPERWNSSLKDGYLRDKKGQLQLPIIMIRRVSFTRNDQFMTFNRHLNETFVRKYSDKNKYSKFAVLNPGISLTPTPPVKEIFNVTLPDQILMQYECVAWTNFVSQLNKIIERINFSTEEYWGDPKRFKFRVRISEYSNTTEVQADDDRLVKATFNLEVWGYLLPETFENHKATTQRFISPNKIILGVETSVNQKELYTFNASKVQQTANTLQQTNNKSPAIIRKQLFEFLAIQKTVYGIFVSESSNLTTIKFTNVKLIPTPSVLINSVSELGKFSLFADGNIINKSSVISFEEIDSNFIVTLSTNSLPIKIDSSTEIYSLGKFE